MAIILPQSMVPPKSPDLVSAYTLLGGGKICDRLDQVRANANVTGKEHVTRIDTAIMFLTLDMGYDAEMVWEIMGDAYHEITAESDLHMAGLKRKKGHFSGSGKVG